VGYAKSGLVEIPLHRFALIDSIYWGGRQRKRTPIRQDGEGPRLSETQRQACRRTPIG
jgi:hypothetical protein